MRTVNWQNVDLRAAVGGRRYQPTRTLSRKRHRNSNAYVGLVNYRPPPRSRFLPCLASFLFARGLSGHFFLRFPPHLYQRIDKVIDRLALLSVPSHPYEGVEKIVNGFQLFRHAAY